MRRLLPIVCCAFAASCHDGSRGPDPARFVYVGTAQSIVSLRVDADGILHPMGVVRSPVGIHDVVVHPNGRFVYVAGGSGADVQVFRTNGTDGQLEFVGAPPGIPEGGRSIDLVLTKDGRFLVAAFARSTDTEYLASYAIDATSGQLTRVGERVYAGAGPEGLEFDFTGTLLIVMQQGTASRGAFRFDPATGHLGDMVSSSSLVAAGSQGTIGPYVTRTSGIGVRAWAADRTRDELRTYGFSNVNANMVEIAPELPLALDHGWAQLPLSMIVAPSAKQAWIGDFDQLVVLALDAEGTPTIVDRSNVWSHVGYLATDPGATRLFAGGTRAGGVWLGDYQGVVFGRTLLPGFTAGDDNDHLGNFRLEAGTGRLEWTEYHRMADHITAIAVDAGATVTAEPRLLLTVDSGAAGGTRCRVDAGSGALANATALATAATPVAVAVVPSGRFAFFGHRDGGEIVTAAVDLARGTVTPTGASTALGSGLSALVAEPQGRFLFAARESPATVTTLAVDATGGTSAGSTLTLAFAPIALVVAPSGANVFALAADGTTAVLSVDPDSGALGVSSASAVATAASAIAIDPSGQHVYVTSSGEDVVRTLRLARASTGFPSVTADTLTPIGSPAATGQTPSAIVVHPTGRTVYVANIGSDDVATFRRDPETGLLTGIGLRVPAGTDPVGLAIGADGRFLYVANRGSDDVTTFAIDAADGTLREVGREIPVGDAPVGVLVLNAYR